MKRLRLLDRLGIDESDAIVGADVSIHQEEFLYEQLKTSADMDHQIGYMDRQLSQLENELRDIRNEQHSLQFNSPTEEERRKAEEWPSIRNRLAEAKAYVQMSRSNRGTGNLQMPLLLLLVAVLFSIVGVIGDQWLIVVMGISIAVVAVLVRLRKRGNDPSQQLNEMERFVDDYAGQEAMMEALSEKVKAFEQKQSRLAEAARVIERKMGVLEAEYGALMQEKERLEQSLSSFFLAYGLRKIPNSGILHEFFGMARSLQETERELEEMDRKIETILNHLQHRQSEVAQFMSADVPEASIYEALRAHYLTMKEAAQSFMTLTKQLEEYQMQKQHAEDLVSSLRSQQLELFKEADANSEAEYYGAYDKFQETLTLTQQIEDLDAQLSAHGAVDEDIERSEAELREEVQKTDKALTELEEKMSSLVKEKTTLEVETDKLLTDDTYQSKQQLFEMKKAEFNELAKQWSVRQAIVKAIKGMMEELKEKKLPEVLSNAEKLFSELTGNAYTSLVLSENGLFHAVARNGRHYPIIELSQATKEQAYIALRLSLANAKGKSAPFPLLLDDPFVHFDEERYSRMMKIMERLSVNHQFIYFTCHDKIIEYWTDATIINVSDIGSAKGAMIR